MNETKDKKELAKELDSVISEIANTPTEEETKEDKKKKKLWEPEVVTIIDSENLTIGQRQYRLVHNHRDGFNAEKLGERFSEVLSRYDYIVGDWGYEQLRLKGFFNACHKKAQDDQKIDTIEDYLYEYCNFGCAFFVLERIGGNHDKRDERLDYEEDFRPRRKKKRTNNRPRNKAYIEEKTEKVGENKPVRKQKPVYNKKKKHTSEGGNHSQSSEKKRNFTIRQKD